jgi:hypothetical protein
MPNTLPGMSPRLATSWVSRQRQNKGFIKNQLLEVEDCRQKPVGGQTSKAQGQQYASLLPLFQLLLLFMKTTYAT